MVYRNIDKICYQCITIGHQYYYMFISVDDRLEDEDYDLIRENTGINVPKVSILCTLYMYMYVYDAIIDIQNMY